MTEPTPPPTPPVLPNWTPPPAAYGYPYGGYAPQRPTNGMAVAAMVVSIVGLASICAYGIGSILICPVGAILGHVARKRIRERGELGAGMALTGIIVGWIGFGLGLVVTAAFAWFIWWAVQNTPPSSGY